MTSTQVILVFSNLPALFVAVYAAVNFRKFEKELRVFSGFLFVNIIIQLFSSVMSLNSVNNMPLLHLYTVCAGGTLLLFYHRVLQVHISSSIIRLLAFGFVCYSVIDSIFIEDLYSFNSISLTVLSVLIIILSLSTFNLQLMESMRVERKSHMSGLNWINSGLFIYFSTSLLLNYFGNQLMNMLFSDEFARLIWFPHMLFMIIMHTCIFIGLWKSLKQ